MTGQDLAQLLSEARTGDLDARERVFERFYPTVERLVHARLSKDVRIGRPWLNSRFSTGDVVQEVFRGLMDDLGAFRGNSEEALCSYLAISVKHKLVDALRFHQAQQRDGRRTAVDSSPGWSECASPGPAAKVSSQEELVRFQQILSELPARERLLLRARMESDLSFTDLAEQLGYGSRSAAQRAFYALRAKLAVEFGPVFLAHGGDARG